MDYFEELDGVAVNPSTEPAIGEVISRRTMLKGMAASGAFGLFGCATMTSGSSADGSAPLTFKELPRTNDDKAYVASGYAIQVLLREGDPIRRGAPAYRPGQQTGSEQELQFGTDPDFISFMPLPELLEQAFFLACISIITSVFILVMAETSLFSAALARLLSRLTDASERSSRI